MQAATLASVKPQGTADKTDSIRNTCVTLHVTSKLMIMGSLRLTLPDMSGGAGHSTCTLGLAPQVKGGPHGTEGSKGEHGCSL